MTVHQRAARPWQATVIKVVVVYMLVAGLWIAFSDRILEQLVQGAEELSRWQTLKGWLFVITTGGLLFAYLNRYLRLQHETFKELTMLFDSLPAIVYVADMDTYELLFVNGYTSERFGRDWRGQNCYSYLQEGQKQACGFCSNPLLLQAGHPGPPVTWEFRNTKNGHWYQCLDKAVRWPNGRLVRIEIALDITERKETERTKDELLSAVSHEMLTPLTAITGFAELLLDERSVPQPAQRYVETISREAEKLQELIQAFLEVKRLKTDQARVDYETLSLHNLLEQVPADHSECSGTHQLAIDCAAELVVFGNRRELKQAFKQLIGNACRFSPDGGRITVKAQPENDSIQIIIADQGIGIPAEEQERIFEPFHRLDIGDRRRVRGVGLGLAMVREIISLHGGSIHVESTEGKGSRFVVKLPKAQPALTADRHSALKG